jgi:hypothetical protein
MIELAVDDMELLALAFDVISHVCSELEAVDPVSAETVPPGATIH